MRVLVIGGGGREHAIAWKIAQSPKVVKVFVLPGNAGTANEKKIKNIDLGERYNPEGLVEFATEKNIDLTIVGPEKFLVEGIVDLFKLKGLKIIGPTKSAARLEGSKNFSKSFMLKHAIPTSNFESFTNSFDAKEYIKKQNFPLVIKADGLAGGKGVTVVKSLSEGYFTIDDYLEKKRFGTSTNTIVIEDFVVGREVSFIALTDGNSFFSFPLSQDHKRLLDDDQGPNTGGMGAYSPVGFVDDKLHRKIVEVVIKPTINGMKKEGTPYTGFLYAGLMISPDNDIKVLEYNCRLGDPEAQVLMMKMKGDFLNVLELAVDKNLEQFNDYNDFWDCRSSLGVVIATAGYPKKPELGEKIKISPEFDPSSDSIKIFYAGTNFKDGFLLTSGGRVFCVSVLDNDLSKARDKVYSVVNKIDFEKMQFRKDIAKDAID